MRRLLLTGALCGIVGASFGFDVAIDLASSSCRDALPRLTQVSHACALAEGLWADGSWAYRFQVTKPWTGDLPQWPSVNLPVGVADWSAYDRLVIEVYNDSIGGDVLTGFIATSDGRLSDGLQMNALPLRSWHYERWIVPLNWWPKTMDRTNVGRMHFFMSTPSAADVYLSGFYLLKPGEALPPISERFLAEKVRPGQARAAARARSERKASVARFVASCREAGQLGRTAWVGEATSMEKILPRDPHFEVRPASRFALRLARGEYESFQVLVMPCGQDLKGVSVEVLGLTNAVLSQAFKCMPVGYVETKSPPPYFGAVNVATNSPGGYRREKVPLSLGWWPDPILEHLDAADIACGDLQAFWVRCHCPEDLEAGVYRGFVRVKGANWHEDFPLAVRVYGFNVPRKSPLPLAITFNPGPSEQFATPEELRQANAIRRDPGSPMNIWAKHEREWGDFLADYYITMDCLYHRGNRIRWEVLKRLEKQSRLGLFNIGYWDYVKDLSSASQEAWRGKIRSQFDEPYAKAKKLGLLGHAYLYGCDEVKTNFFPQMAWSVAELRKMYPGVPLLTTAYEHRFGIDSPLADIDWFTPLTSKFEEHFAQIEPSRRAGHQVWWYICCGPHAPFANMFVESSAIEGRILMGAQSVKARPDGFLYYQISIWNSSRPIDGISTFTDWEPRSWTRYHGDGSWVCCGPDGMPLATMRLENFRDGLEDYAYACEYERVTGSRCEVPAAVCRSMSQFTDDPQVLYAWRERIAKGIEQHRR